MVTVQKNEEDIEVGVEGEEQAEVLNVKLVLFVEKWMMLWFLLVFLKITNSPLTCASFHFNS